MKNSCKNIITWFGSGIVLSVFGSRIDLSVFYQNLISRSKDILFEKSTVMPYNWQYMLYSLSMQKILKI